MDAHAWDKIRKQKKKQKKTSSSKVPSRGLY